MIIAVQTFSDDLGWHPHLHALMTDGVFDEDGVFIYWRCWDYYTRKRQMAPYGHGDIMAGGNWEMGQRLIDTHQLK